jgi:hypothetical protein
MIPRGLIVLAAAGSSIAAAAVPQAERDVLLALYDGPPSSGPGDSTSCAHVGFRRRFALAGRKGNLQREKRS